ncbi:sensor domain-containing diguanylate cyclase [Nocardia sp. NPDC052254]|uniref:sensor domain-containing diguanylate cyclase n=1 Tax=Nocardia sp. NPDC052254 TaxID=3155681 RepID=UPI003425D3BC
MDDLEYTAFAQQWRRALASLADSTPYTDVAISLLSELLHDLRTGVDAPEFDPAVGSRVGAALADARLTDAAVPVVSAPVLYGLIEYCDHPEAGPRLAALLAAFGQGHREASVPDAAVQSEYDKRFRIVFDHASIAIAVGDTDGALLEANPHLAAMIGVPQEALHGISVYDFAHPDDQNEIRRMVYEKLVPAQEGTARIERRLLRADGSVGWAAFAITYVKGAGDEPDYLLAIGEDVTERHQLQEQLHYQARHDALTGLPNRRHLLEQLSAVIEVAEPPDRMGLCFTDLDHFKEVNDRYGHGTGDQVLATVGRRLDDSLDGLGCLVTRIGGDEFVVMVFPPADNERVTAVADRLRGALSEPIVVGGHRLHISASIGAVVTPIAGTDPEWLLDAADTTLYQAKSDAKGDWILHNVHRADGDDSRVESR